MTATLTLESLARLVEATRKAQAAYFDARRCRSATTGELMGLLADARQLEKELDEAAARILRPRRRDPLPGQMDFLSGGEGDS